MTDCKKCKVKRECEDLAEMGIIDMTCKEVEEYAKVGSEESDELNTERD